MSDYNLIAKKTNHEVKAAVLLALVIVAAYSPMIFLGQSHDYSRPIPRELLDYNSSKIPAFNVTIDPGADFEQNWPVMKLATDLYKEGKIPLWDPYIGGGQPLAADTINYIFSPLMIGFLLPVELWDIPLLAALWVAGFTMFLFVRSLGLNFTASICGGMFYMLSGAFTWYLPHTSVAVMIFTPFILYSLEKIIQNKNSKYIVLLSISILLGILGAHLESIVLQIMLAGLYLVYRIVYLGVSRHHTSVELSENNPQFLTFNIKRILLWSALGFVGGLGLSAFFILPVYEFIENGYLSHDNIGIGHDEPHVILPAFVPYVLGQVQSYWSQSIRDHAGSWDGLWGYVGMFALFFSIIGVFFSLKNKINNHHRYTPLFFVTISIFFIMKTVGVPVVNWIGYLPVLNMMVFTRYAGVIVPIGFAVAAAFGIDLLSKVKLRTKTLALICLISISIILLLLIPYLPYLSSDAKFATGVSTVDARNYVGFQILQAILFTFMAFLLSIAISKNKSAIVGIIPLILLELFLYIPIGLPTIWMAYKSIVVLAGVTIITLLVLKPNRFSWNKETKNVKFYIIVGVLITTISGGVLVSEASPYGMMKRYDSFQHDPITNFLKENLGNSRMFSFDNTLAPNFSVAYKISTLGIMSAFNINSFYSFNHNFLDQNAWLSNLGYLPWTSSSGGSLNAVDKFFQNKKYFDFLGVKYILTEGSDLNSFASGGARTSTFRQIGPNDNNTGQNFISPLKNISGIGVAFGTYLLQNHGTVVLTINSVPYDTKYHRESSIDAENITDAQFNEFKFTPPLTDTLNKQFYLSLKYPQTDAQNRMAVFYYDENTDPTWFNTVKDKLHGQFYENGILVSGKEMSFSIVKTENFPTALKFHNINIYENTNAFPHTFLVNKFHVVNSSKAQDYLLQNPNFDLRNEVILENQLPQEWVNRLESSVAGTSNAEITSYSEDKVTIHTNTKDASLLVLTDTYYPGWKSYVDGKESNIYRADGLVRAVFVPEGSHTVEFSYMPNSFVNGMIISFVTAGILLGIVIYSKKAEKRNIISSDKV